MIDIRYEIEFWTQILRDHAEFQYSSLAPYETEAINTATKFMNLFKEYHDKVVPETRQFSKQELMELVSDNKVAVTQFVQFKKQMLTRLLTCNIALAMSPTFLNHMINEAMEFYRVLSLYDQTLRDNQTLENIRLHKIWLPDASGHAKFIVSQLDGVESIYINQAEDFQKKFDCFFKKASEMYLMYERTNLNDSALHQFNQDVEKTMNEFISFLDLICGLKQNCRIYSTGTFTPLVPDHMMREENYYLYKIKIIEDNIK